MTNTKGMETNVEKYDSISKAAFAMLEIAQEKMYNFNSCIATRKWLKYMANEVLDNAIAESSESKIVYQRKYKNQVIEYTEKQYYEGVKKQINKLKWKLR